MQLLRVGGHRHRTWPVVVGAARNCFVVGQLARKRRHFGLVLVQRPAGHHVRSAGGRVFVCEWRSSGLVGASKVLERIVRRWRVGSRLAGLS